MPIKHEIYEILNCDIVHGRSELATGFRRVETAVKLLPSQAEFSPRTTKKSRSWGKLIKPELLRTEGDRMDNDMGIWERKGYRNTGRMRGLYMFSCWLNIDHRSHNLQDYSRSTLRTEPLHL